VELPAVLPLEADPVPAAEPLPLEATPGVALPMVEPDAPARGAVADPEPLPIVLELEPPPDVEPLELTFGPGVMAPELVPVPGEPPPDMVDGIEDVVRTRCPRRRPGISARRAS
jgi:hypothetical protein